MFAHVCITPLNSLFFTDVLRLYALNGGGGVIGQGLVLPFFVGFHGGLVASQGRALVLPILQEQAHIRVEIRVGLAVEGDAALPFLAARRAFDIDVELHAGDLLQLEQELAPSIKDLEHFADKYSKNAEKVLPEAGALESAKTYREKRAKPLYEKIITVLRDLYKQFKDLVKKYNRLVTAYNNKCSDYEQLEGHCQWLEGENSQLSGRLHTVQSDFSRVRRVLGDATVDEVLLSAKQLEQETEQREMIQVQQRQHNKSRNRSYPSL